MAEGTSSSERSVTEIQVLLERLKKKTSIHRITGKLEMSSRPGASSDVSSWQAVNRLLRQHGLPTINAIAISELLPTSEGVMLSNADVSQLLKAITQLAADGEHSRRINHNLLKQLSMCRSMLQGDSQSEQDANEVQVTIHADDEAQTSLTNSSQSKTPTDVSVSREEVGQLVRTYESRIEQLQHDVSALRQQLTQLRTSNRAKPTSMTSQLPIPTDSSNTDTSSSHGNTLDSHNVSWMNLETKVEQLTVENTRLKKQLQESEEKVQQQEREQQQGPPILRSVNWLACRKHLAATCKQLGVTNVRFLSNHLQTMQVTLRSVPYLHKFVSDVVSTVSQSGLPHAGTIQVANHEAWCERSLENVLPTLRLWADLLCQPEREETDKESDIDVQAVLRHFQQLFNVRSKIGIVTAMNKLYSHVTEMENVMSALRNVLQVNRKCSANLVVTRVSELCQRDPNSLRAELAAARTELKNCQKFLLCFRDVAENLMAMLGVDRLGDVLPRVEELMS